MNLWDRLVNEVGACKRELSALHDFFAGCYRRELDVPVREDTPCGQCPNDSGGQWHPSVGWPGGLWRHTDFCVGDVSVAGNFEGSPRAGESGSEVADAVTHAVGQICPTAPPTRMRSRSMKPPIRCRLPARPCATLLCYWNRPRDARGCRQC